MTRWFRFYDAVLDDPKVQRLPDPAFRAWVNLMCLASRNGGKISENWADLSFALRKSIGKTRELLRVLISVGLVDQIENGFEPHNWETRQYKSDVSTARVKRFRQRSGNSDVTAPEQIQNRAEQKEEVVAPPAAAPPKPKPVTGSRWPSDQEVPSEWIFWVKDRFRELGRAPPNLAVEAVKFANHWASKTGKDATKVDWKKTFLNWCLNARSVDKPRSAHDNLNAGVSDYIRGLESEAGREGQDSDSANKAGQLLLAP